MSEDKSLAEDLAKEPLLAAGIDLIGRTGAKNIQLRYSDDPGPLIWIADAEWKEGRLCGAGFTPADAVFVLCENAVDGGHCAHCGRPSGVTENWEEDMPAAHVVCWYVFDPETQKFRRSCEGDT